jgi:hypothetical protein
MKLDFMKYGKGATSQPSNFSEPLLNQAPFLQPEASKSFKIPANAGPEKGF